MGFPVRAKHVLGLHLIWISFHHNIYAALVNKLFLEKYNKQARFLKTGNNNADNKCTFPPEIKLFKQNLHEKYEHWFQHKFLRRFLHIRPTYLAFFSVIFCAYFNMAMLKTAFKSALE